MEVDLEYISKRNSRLTQGLPISNLKLRICNENMLSQVQKDIHKYYYGKEATDEKTNKLVLNVMDKKKYVLHISALKFYLQHGLKLKESP